MTSYRDFLLLSGLYSLGFSLWMYEIMKYGDVKVDRVLLFLNLVLKLRKEK